MTFNDLIGELKISEDYIYKISNKITYDNNNNEIDNVLKKYDVHVLEDVKQRTQIYSDKLYKIIMERRNAYIDKVRRIEAIGKKNKEVSENSKWIDFSNDVDNTENLVCGMNVLSKSIDKINFIIKDKIEFERNKKQKHYYTVIVAKLIIVITIFIIIINIYIK